MAFSPHRGQSVDHSVSRFAHADDSGGLQPRKILSDTAHLQCLHGPDRSVNYQLEVFTIFNIVFYNY